MPKINSVKSKLHAVEYQHEGQAWIIEVPASSEADTLQRIAMMQYGTYLGEVQFKMPATLGPFARLSCLLRNAFRRNGQDVG